MTDAANEVDRVRALRVLLDRANRAYYVDADPIMSDRDFDARLEELAVVFTDELAPVEAAHGKESETFN